MGGVFCGCHGLILLRGLCNSKGRKSAQEAKDQEIRDRERDIMAAMTPGAGGSMLGVFEMIAELRNPSSTVDEVLARQKTRDANRMTSGSDDW